MQKCTGWEGREGEGTKVERTCPCYPHSQGLLSLDGYVSLVSFWIGSLEKSVNVGDEQFTFVVQSNLVNMDTKGAIESVPIKEGSVLSGDRKCKGSLSPRTKQQSIIITKTKMKLVKKIT